MSNLVSVATKLEAILDVEFLEAEVAGHLCLAADVADTYAMMERVRPLAVDSERGGNLLFVGVHGDDGPHRLFLMPALSSLDVIELFKVGTHNASDDGWRAVHDALKRIHGESSFSVYFADAAGYKATFAAKPDEKAAKRFEQLVLEVDPEAMDLSDEPVWETIHEQGVLQLWWD